MKSPSVQWSVGGVLIRIYHDKYDLVDKFSVEAMRALFDAVSEPASVHSPQIWVRFFEHIAEYERLYRALLGGKAAPGLC